MPYKKGKSGNPSGRPKGARNKETELRNFLFDIFTKNQEQAEKMIKEMYLQKNKHDFKWIMGIMVSLLPKDMGKGISVPITISFRNSDRVLTRTETKCFSPKRI